MNVSPEHEQDLLSMDDDRKWKLIRSNVSACRPCGTAFIKCLYAQSQVPVAFPPDYFVEQLRRHLDPELR